MPKPKSVNPKPDMYVVYKDCPGLELKEVGRLPGHPQAMGAIEVLNERLTESERKAGCKHSIQKTK